MSQSNEPGRFSDRVAIVTGASYEPSIGRSTAERLAREGAAVVINARGEAALRSTEKELRGAGLDVFREEPLPPDSPLWELDNVLITPHIGGTSQRFWDRQTELMIRNIGNYLAGLSLENLVDKRLGY